MKIEYFTSSSLPSGYYLKTAPTDPSTPCCYPLSWRESIATASVCLAAVRLLQLALQIWFVESEFAHSSASHFSSFRIAGLFRPCAVLSTPPVQLSGYAPLPNAPQDGPFDVQLLLSVNGAVDARVEFLRVVSETASERVSAYSCDSRLSCAGFVLNA